MENSGGYQSLLGLTTINSNSSTIDVLDVENITINGVIDLSQAIVGGLTTSQVDEGLNLYYTDTRVNNNSNVSSNTTHRDRTDNPHGVTATQVGIDDTDDISEGVTNLYYTDIRFDDRLATKTTSSLTEGSNLYYTDARFDSRFGIKTTTDLTEGTNLYYTTTRANADFDTRFGIKTTTDLTEGTNLYYTDARFDTRFGTKTTTDLTEGTNLYYTDARFDTRLAIKTTDNLTEGTNLYYTTARANTDFDARLATKTTDNLTEGSNLYYTEARVSANTNVSANTAKVSADGSINTHSDVSILEVQDQQFLKYSSFTQKWANVTATTAMIAEHDNLYYTDARFDTRFATKTTTNLTEGTNLYYTEARFDTSFGVKKTTDLTEGINLYYTDGRFDTRLATKTTTDLTEGTNLYYTEARVSANNDVKANTAYRNTGHLPLAGGTLTGNLNMGNQDIDNVNQIFIDRKSVANNKLVLWDNGTPSTTAFYGFGIQSGTLLYNVDTSGANHKFYYAGTNELFRIGDSGIYSYRNSNITGDLTVNGEINIGGAKIARGATNGLQLYGTLQNLTGPHLQAFVSSDTYPTYQLLNWSHNNVNMTFDAYFDGSWRSSSTSSNLLINKASTSVTFQYDSGIGLGSVVTWNTGLSMNTTNGLVTCGNGLSVTGNITVTGTVDGVDVAALNTSVVKLTGDQTVAGIKSFSSRIQVTGNASPTSGIGVELGYTGTDGVILSYDRGNNLYMPMRYNALSHSLESSGIEILNISSTGVDITGNITVSGTVDGVDIAALETAVSANTAKVSYPSADSTKVGFISVTQAVDLDAMESDITTNNAKVSYPSADATKVGFISVTQAVDLDAMESDIATNNAKVSYPSADSTKVGFISVTQAVNLDTMESNIATNNAKISYTDSTKVGFISVTQAVNLDTMETDITSNNAYRNVGHLPLEGGTMTGDITMGGQVPTTYNGPTMTSATAPAPYVITSSSSLAAGSQYQAFDGLNYNAWESTPNTRYDSSGVLIGTPYPRPISDIKYFGEWIQVDLGANYIIPSYSIDPTNTSGGAPKSWTVGVSPDGATFTLLDRKIDQTYAVETTFTPATPLVARYIVMSIDKVSGSAGKVIMTGLSYEYETPNYSIYNLKEPTDTHYAATKGYVDSNVQTLNTAISGKLSLAGGGVITNGSINIYTQARSGSHGTVKGLYVTSDFGAYSSGAEFRHSNGTSGVGIGYAGIYACGSTTNQNLTISTKGTGVLNLVQNGVTYAVSRRRPNYYNEGQLSIRKQGSGGAGEIGYGGSLYAWASSNTAGDPTGGYAYMTTGASTWSAASDRRLKCDILDLKTDDCCSKICLLKPRNYYWKTDETKKMNTGFIADEVKQVYPELVSNSNVKIGDDENIEGIDYTGMIPILVGAIQSMMGKINELKNRIEILESPII